MIITINTIERSITVEENVKFTELIAWLEKQFPGGEWKDYKLMAAKLNNNYVPYYPTISPAPLQPYYFDQPVITCSDGATG